MPSSEPNEQLIYQLAIFAVEPAFETRELTGSLGRVAPDGDLDWHVQIIQVRRELNRFSGGAALAVVYLRIEARQYPNVIEEDDIERAFDLLQRLIAIKELRAERPLSLRLIYAVNYDGTGRGLGGAVFSNMIWGAGSGALGGDGIDPAILEQHPELGHAVRFYVRGIAASDERFLPDALINYARCLECLVGSASKPRAVERECNRLSIDKDEILDLLKKTRAKYAIGHALDTVHGQKRKLKEFPTKEIERSGRECAKGAIDAYIRQLPALDHAAELAKGYRYSGLPPVSTNLPLPGEFLTNHSGPWDQAAPGLMPDLEPLPVVASKLGIRAERLRRLVRRRLITGFKDLGGRWQVSSVSADLYFAYEAELPYDFKQSILVRIRDAAADWNIEASEIRGLIRQRTLAGHLRSRRRWIQPSMVDDNSVRYLMWRRRRERSAKRIYGKRPSTRKGGMALRLLNP